MTIRFPPRAHRFVRRPRAARGAILLAAARRAAAIFVATFGALLPTAPALAADGAASGPASLQTRLADEARAADARFAGFSAERGRNFFTSRHGGDWSCTTCHTSNPAAAGSHKVTGKAIEPLAPAANPARFTRADKVEKWFKRNCNDVLQRPCTAQEKGDVVAYLLTVRP